MLDKTWHIMSRLLWIFVQILLKRSSHLIQYRHKRFNCLTTRTKECISWTLSKLLFAIFLKKLFILLYLQRTTTASHFLSVVSADSDLRSSFLRGLGLWERRKRWEWGIRNCTNVQMYNFRPTVYNTLLNSHFWPWAPKQIIFQRNKYSGWTFSVPSTSVVSAFYI